MIFGAPRKYASLADQLERLVRRDRGERERPGADRIALEVVAALLHRLLRHDEALRIVGQDAEYARDIVLQHQADGVGIHRLDGLERPHLGGERRGLGIARLLQAEHDVIGGEFAEAAVELHAVAQVEGPGLAVLGGFPLLGEIRLQRGRIGAARREPHQAVEHQRGGDAVDGGDGEMRIELADVLRRHAEIQRGLRLRHGGRGERDSGGQKGWREAACEVLPVCCSQVSSIVLMRSATVSVSRAGALPRKRACRATKSTLLA